MCMQTYGVSQSKDMEKMLKPFTSGPGAPDYCCVSATLQQGSQSAPRCTS